MPFSPDDDISIPNGTAAPGEAFPQEGGTLEGLAVSPDGSTLYFATATTLFDHDGDGGDGITGTAPIVKMGGIYSYALTGNAAGTYTLIYQQVVGSGPQGLIDDLEIDFTTNSWYVADLTGGTGAPGDEGVWRGSLSGGTPTLFASINTAGGQIPGSVTLDIAPTLTGTETGATATEQPGSGSGFSTPVFALTGESATSKMPIRPISLPAARVRISAGTNAAPGSVEQLTINGTTNGLLGSGISYSYNAATGVMTLAGISSFANYNAALALVGYSISGDNPDAYGAAPTRTLSYSVSDGLVSSDEFDATVSIGAVNDAPVNTDGGPVAWPKSAGPTAITGLAVSDVDASPAADTIQVTLSATLGSITVSTVAAGGLTAGQVAGNGSGSVVLTGTQNQINATLSSANGVLYTPGASGVDALVMTTNDLGENGAAAPSRTWMQLSSR